MNADTAMLALGVQTIAVVISAKGVVASISWSRIVARRRTTIDMVLAEQTKDELLVLRSKFLEAAKNNKLLELSQGRNWLSAESFPLVSTLNRYEITAIGIAEGIIDERIYKRYWRTSLVRDWLRCQAAVRSRRSEFGKNLFSEFESLARKWANQSELAEFIPKSN